MTEMLVTIVVMMLVPFAALAICCADELTRSLGRRTKESNSARTNVSKHERLARAARTDPAWKGVGTL